MNKEIPSGNPGEDGAEPASEPLTFDYESDEAAESEPFNPQPATIQEKKAELHRFAVWAGVTFDEGAI